tara:strand:- start:2376 stop:2672 length:297 start_codon:yes stop_codon:yes gene_type:complete
MSQSKTIWKRNHDFELLYPRTEEAKILVELLDLIKHTKSWMDQDRYGIPNVLVPLIESARQMLNYEIGALDAGTIDGWLNDMAISVGWDLNEDDWHNN